MANKKGFVSHFILYYLAI